LVTIRIDQQEETLTWEQWEQRVADGRVPPTAQVRFEPVTGEAFVPAAELDLFHSLRDDRRREWSDRYTAGSPPWMTALLVGVQIRLWWLMRTGDAMEVRDTLQLWQPAVLEEGEVWRMLTAGFTHWSVGHIASNLLMLVYIGWFLERALGRVNLLVIFIMSVLGGSVLSMTFTPAAGSLGASGGVLGVVAAATVFGFVRFGLLPDRARIVFGWALLPYLILIYGIGWMSETTDNWAHTGGLVTGGLLALVLDPPGLERRKGWNLSFILGCAASTAVLLGLLWWQGARLIRIEDTMARLPDSFEPSRHRDLVYSAPRTWKTGLVQGTRGYTSLADIRRGFAARVRRRTGPAVATEELAAMREDLQSEWQHLITLDPEEAATIAGVPGLHQVAHIDDVDGITVERWVAVRGSYVLEVTWSVDDKEAGRLSSLRDRLVAAVQWNEPSSLIEAQTALERHPKSRPLRRDLADELIAAGRVEEALDIWTQLVAERETTPDGWVGLLTVARHHPDAVPDLDRLYREALKRAELPEVQAEVALALDQQGDHRTAFGLLEQAWFLAPGDRHLRRARKLVGLPTGLVDTVPAQLLSDPLTGDPLPAPRRTPTEVDLDAAGPLGDTMLAERQAAFDLAMQRPWPEAIPALLLVRDGALPPLEELEIGLNDVALDLRATTRGSDIRWLTPDQRAAVAARLQTDPIDDSVLAAPNADDPEAFGVWLTGLGLGAVAGPRGPALHRVDPGAGRP